MHNYSVPDFVRYYAGSYLLHPKTHAVVKVRGASKTTAECIVLSDKTELSLHDLDWKHVVTPPLGYRSLDEGRLLYYVTRRAGRLSEKGVTPQAIVIEIPPVLLTIAKQLNKDADLVKHASLEDKLATALYYPEFKKLEEALALLSNRKHCIGLALNNSWAVTIGTHKQSVFLLHFKNQRVAQSADGKTWKFVDKESETLFNRSCL